MLRRGDIAVERLTGRKTMVIDVAGPEEVTCRFGDGRLEDRFVFELDPAPPTWLDTLWALAKSPFASNTAKKRPTASASPRPRLARSSSGPS